MPPYIFLTPEVILAVNAFLGPLEVLNAVIAYGSKRNTCMVLGEVKALKLSWCISERGFDHLLEL